MLMPRGQVSHVGPSMPSGSKRRGLQVIQHGRAGQLLDDGGEHVGRGAVVDEVRAGLVLHGQGEERFHPVAIRGSRGGAGGVLVVPGGHGEQVPHAHGRQVFVGLRGRVVGEEGDDRRVYGQPSFGNGEADGGGREALAQREEHVRVLGRIGSPPALGRHLAMAQQHEAVQAADLLLDGVDECQDGRRSDPDCLGAGPGQLAASRGSAGGVGWHGGRLAQDTGGGAEGHTLENGAARVARPIDAHGGMLCCLSDK